MSFVNHESEASKSPSFNPVKLGYGGARNPGNGGDSVKGNSYYALYVDEWLELVNSCLNPYDQPVTEENVNILTHSYDTGFYSTTGVIAGGRDSFAAHPSYVQSTPTPEPAPEPTEPVQTQPPVSEPATGSEADVPAE